MGKVSATHKSLAQRHSPHDIQMYNSLSRTELGEVVFVSMYESALCTYRLASVCAIAHLPPFPFRKQALLKDASFNSLTYEEISAHKVCLAEVRKAYSTEISPLQFKYYFFVKYVFEKYIPPSPQQYQV